MRRIVQKNFHNVSITQFWSVIESKKRIMMPGLRCLQIKTNEVVFEQNGFIDMSFNTGRNWTPWNGFCPNYP